MKLRSWRLPCIAVAFALGAAACGSGTTTEVAVPAAETVAPTLNVSLEADAKSGQNLHLTTSDFTFTPENSGGPDVANEGYAHISLDGAAPMRLYSDWVHLSLAPGEHEVRTTLVTNSGDAYDGTETVVNITVPEADTTGHSHGHSDSIEVVGDAPEISLTVSEDPSSGWNVHAEITNFRLAPESASGEPAAGEGHLHLLVNGVKVQRLYGNWWHLEDLPGGENTVTVEANANNHAPYVVHGEPVMASVVVTGSGAAIDGMEDMAEDTSQDEHDGMTDHGDNEDAEHSNALMITVNYQDGEITGVEGRTEVELGQTVMLSISSDAAEHVHVHGYDLFADVGGESDGKLVFVADIPGVFEIEFEDSGVLITELEVR